MITDQSSQVWGNGQMAHLGSVADRYAAPGILSNLSLPRRLSLADAWPAVSWFRSRIAVFRRPLFCRLSLRIGELKPQNCNNTYPYFNDR